jgi:hypothetical protein
MDFDDRLLKRKSQTELLKISKHSLEINLTCVVAIITATKL